MRNLSPQEKRALLAARLKQKAAQSETEIPLAFSQEALWFLHQRNPHNTAYNTAFTLRIHAPLSVATLQRALDKVALRHTALRTRFTLKEGLPTQIIQGYRTVPLEQIAATTWDEEQLKAQVVAAYHRPFDLENDPLMRAHLFTVNSDEHVLLLCFHHIICDAWAIWQIVAEVGAYLENKAATLPAPVNYTEFVMQQREYITQAEGKRDWAYWEQQLQHPLPTLAMPTDKPRVVEQLSPRANSHFFELDHALLQAVQTAAKAHKTTPFVILLTAYYVLLYRYTGQDDLIVGTPTAGRNRPNFSQIVGYLVNPIPLRAQLAGNPKFADLLQKVRQTVLEGLTHQAYPLPLLIQKLRLPRDERTSPLFQTFFVYQQPRIVATEAQMQWGGMPISPYNIPQMEGQFDLHLELTQQLDKFTGVLKYNADCYEANTIERMMRHYATLVRHILTDLDQPIARIELLDSAEKRTLADFNNTARPYPRDLCLHQLFEQQVARTPHAPALRFGDQTVTYAEMNARVNQLAHTLRERGVRQNVLVGVAIERSFEMVIALYAILKAGGAYVPLDPTYPAERLTYMVTDAAVPFVLTQVNLLEKLPEIAAEMICLDRDWTQISSAPTTNPAPLATATDTAYMIYTSGSTGKPKGARNAHRGIVNRLLWMQDEYQLNATDRVLQKTPFSFDVSVWEFFWPLLSGAVLVIALPEGHKDSRYLVETIEREQITTLHFVPSMLNLFLADRDVSRCTSLRRVICSGEALTKGVQDRFFGQLSAELHNLYGPTEAAIDVTYWHCQPNDTRTSVPIGRPVANTQIMIVDPEQQQVPIGVAGELWIGGVQVGQGYHNRPNLTAERFIKTDENTRFYKTGDLARWRIDGTIEYLGRIDFQVKVRGFRIELGEVESALLAHPLVKSAVVIAKKDSGGGHLIAYVVTEDGSDLPATTGRTYLRDTLPEHAIPSHFVTLSMIPLAPNGKVNRKALPEPEQVRPTLAVAFQSPQNSAEKTIATIWQDVLQLDQVGIHDNFFDLGGHSLLLGLVRSRLEKELASQISIVDLFRYTTIQTLAEKISGVTDVENTPLVAKKRAKTRQNRLADLRKNRRRTRS